MTILLVCSMGGHLAEMRRLEPAFKGHRTVLVTYRSPITEELPGTYLLTNFRTNPARYAWGLAQAWRILRRGNATAADAGEKLQAAFAFAPRAVGEVPEATVRQIANAVSFKK